jgi:HAD superfamily hydrolase (TIGR01509 family)
MPTLVLDAMGVIYAAADDVVELLCPFIRERGGLADDARIDELYREASCGRLTAEEFWRQVGVDGGDEDAYLRRHALVPGLVEFLAAVKPEVSGLWCLSNDISQWSRKLRERLQLERYFDGWVISGDVGARKPDLAIYRRLLAAARAKAEDVIFVDDRSANLDAARSLGFQTILFAPRGGAAATPHRQVADFSELLKLVRA